MIFHFVKSGKSQKALELVRGKSHFVKSGKIDFSFSMLVRSQVEPRHIKKALELVRGRIKNVTR